MRQRYFVIEPKYSDPDTFCSFIVGSDRVRASIQIYADLSMLSGAAKALTDPSLTQDAPPLWKSEDDGPLFNFFLTVLPREGGNKCLRFRIFQDFLDDDAPYRADIRFNLSAAEAEELGKELRAWCANPLYPFVWKGD